MVIRGELDATKVLGIREGTEAELDALFDLVDEDRSNSITRDEWHEFVGHRKKAPARARAPTLRHDREYMPTHTCA